MSLRQVADLAYVSLRDLVEARANTNRIITGFARVLGGEAELVDPDEVLAVFDEGLRAEPAGVDPDQAELLRELGVG